MVQDTDHSVIPMLLVEIGQVLERDTSPDVELPREILERAWKALRASRKLIMTWAIKWEELDVDEIVKQQRIARQLI